MARVALIGSNGQLGTDIARLWPGRRNDELIALSHADIEVADTDLVRSVIGGIKPNLVINTAAFHRVDDCEAQAMAALRINAIAVKNLAEICREAGAVLMHFSTDYVFDGLKGSPYAESDAARPISAYGISKLAGEEFLRYMLPDSHILIRSSGLYGIAGASAKGGNFVETMLRLVRQGQPLRVVNDQISTPTHTYDLAEALIDLIDRDARGTFHITNAGACSWYEFATEIFALTGQTPQMEPVSAAEFGSAARRPAYSVLANTRLAELGLHQPRPWQEALAHYLRLKGHLAA